MLKDIFSKVKNRVKNFFKRAYDIAKKNIVAICLFVVAVLGGTIIPDSDVPTADIQSVKWFEDVAAIGYVRVVDSAGVKLCELSAAGDVDCINGHYSGDIDADDASFSGNVTMETDDAYIGADTDNQIMFNGTTGNQTIDADTAFLLDVPFAQFQADNAWIGRSAANNIEFDLAGGMIDLDAGTGIDLDAPYAEFQTDGAWIGRDATASAVYFNSSNVVSMTTTTAQVAIQQVGSLPAVLGGYVGNVYSGAGAETMFGGYSGNPNSILSGGGGNTVFGAGNTANGTQNGTMSGGALHNMTSGAGSTIGGGTLHVIYMDFALSNDSTIGGGYNNVITDTLIGGRIRNTIGGGEQNTIEEAGLSTIAGGENNYIGTGLGEGTIGGGYGNRVTSGFGTVPGGGMAETISYGQMAYGSGSFDGYATAGSEGQAQWNMYVARDEVTHSDTSWYELYTGDSSGSLEIPSDGMWNVDVQIAGVTNGAPQRWAYNLTCSIVNDGGTTTLLSSATTALTESDANYDARCIADNANDTLDIEVRRSAGTNYTVRWVAVVNVAQVTW